MWPVSVFKRDNSHVFFVVGQVSGLFEDVNIGIYSDAVNVIIAKLCMMVPLIELTCSYHFQ